MNSATKIQIARGTLSLLVVVASIFLLGVVVLVVCAGLQIDPFRETTTSVLLAAFMGLIGVAVVLVLLNVATNISLIADVQTKALLVEPVQGTLGKWLWIATAIAILAVGLILAGTYLSKERYVKVVRAQADEVLRENGGALEEISQLLTSGKPDDFKRVARIEQYLEEQRSGLPQLSIIFQGKFNERPTFYSVYGAGYFADEKTEYVPPYFSCTPKQDCEYLKQFFSGEKVDALEKYHLRDDQFYIYIPYVGKGSRYVLLFQRQNRYGKFGS